MKIRLGDLRRIIKEELSRAILESASLTPRSFAEDEFLRFTKRSSEEEDLAVQKAWNDLKLIEIDAEDPDAKRRWVADFSRVAMELYNSTGFKIDSLGRRNISQGTVSRGGPFERAMSEINPKSVEVSVGEIQSSSWSNDALVQHAAEKRAARNAPRPQDPRPPWPFDPKYPGKREYDEKTKQWKMVDSDPVSGYSYVR